MTIRKRAHRGFLLVEAAIAIVLLTVVTFTAVDLTAKAMLATNWTTHTALADAYLDREAALLRRLGPNDLANRGYTVGSPTTSVNVPLAFFTNGPDATFSANSVIRSLNVVNNTYTYTVQLNMTIQSQAMGTKNYAKMRTVSRTF